MYLYQIEKISTIGGPTRNSYGICEIYFDNAVCSPSVHMVHNGPAIKRDEYVPAKIPIIIGSENSLIESTPNIYTAVMVNKVVKEVFSVLDRVAFMLC